jgi:hypothetical protein
MTIDINKDLLPLPPSREDDFEAWNKWEQEDREAIGKATGGPYRDIREEGERGLADGIRAGLAAKNGGDREEVEDAYEAFKAATEDEPNHSAAFRIAHSYYSSFKDGFNNPNRE